jgi:WD repeat-containing protein 24
MARPMIEVAIPCPPPHETRGRPIASSRMSGNEPDDDNMVVADHVPDVTGAAAISQMNNVSGHPCAAGCGHFCWAATGISGEIES